MFAILALCGLLTPWLEGALGNEGSGLDPSGTTEEGSGIDPDG